MKTIHLRRRKHMLSLWGRGFIPLIIIAATAGSCKDLPEKDPITQASELTGTGNYKFGNYSVQTGFDKDNPTVQIYKGEELLYDNHSGDGIAYFSIDTLSLNNDNIPDFIFGYQVEDYSVVGALVSTKSNANYKEVDILNVFDPLTYEKTNLTKGDSIYTFILKDVNNDNRRDIITNVINNTGDHTWRATQTQTDTIMNAQIISLVNR